LQTFPTLILSLLQLSLLFFLLSLYSFFFSFFFNFKSLLSRINFDIKTSFLVVSIGERSILETQYNNQTLEFVESSQWKKKKKSNTPLLSPHPNQESTILCLPDMCLQIWMILCYKRIYIYIYIYELVSAKKKQAARFRGEKKIKKLIKLKKQ
jgi:beta-lactamase regulating signal transducer with metallopeptidase domain